MTSHAKVQLECDLVMKGGVTSGVVYPSAIIELGRVFRFRRIGGASAGAIAAAMTACAELARQTGTPEALTDGMTLLNADAGAPDFIARRFLPHEQGKALFSLLMAVLRFRDNAASAPGRVRRVFHCLGGLDVHLLKSALAGCFVGLLLTVPLAILAAGDLHSESRSAFALLAAAAVCAPVASIVGALGLVVYALISASLGLRRKDGPMFGLCHGSAGAAAQLSKPEGLPLTDWLHVRMNELARRKPGEVVTMAELSAKGIELKLVTTDLSLGQPFVLPMSRGSRSFFFREEDMRRLFPTPVADFLVAWGKKNRPTALRFKEGEEDVYLRFPFGAELPVVVATRMSLSFPLLISAVRLYSFTQGAYDAFKRSECVDLGTHVEEHWFSDGGITSNFPIQLFDDWVPTRPVFGITLYDSPVKEVLAQREVHLGPSESTPGVLLPQPRDFQFARPHRVRINGLLDFLGAIFDAAQSHRDNVQSGLPSFRERIVQVFLSPQEGGLNLKMGEATIKAIQARGAEAGRALVERYVVETPDGVQLSSHFFEHRWVRLLVLMGRLEQELGAVALNPGTAEMARASLRQLFEAQLEARAPGGEHAWYHARDVEWCDAARSRVEALFAIAEVWRQQNERAGSRLFANPPRPEAHLRLGGEL